MQPVHATTAPILMCSATGSVTQGQASYLTAAGYSFDGQINYSISWGDGSSAFLPTTSNSNGNICNNGQVSANIWAFPTHVYAAAGSYPVMFLFSDNSVTSVTLFVTLTVLPPPPPPPPPIGGNGHVVRL